jgi:hypothetical protein
MEITLQHIVDVIKTGDRTTINEASLNRIYQHIQREASDSFAIITAFRGGYSKQENLTRNKKLEQDVRSLGLGFFKVLGHWVECADSEIDYSDCPKSMLKPVKEDSLFIPNISKKDAVRLTKKYDQDGIVYQGKETDNKVEILGKSGNSIMKLGQFSPNKIAQAYTKVKGKTFTFEGFEYKPYGMMENLMFQILNKK